MTMPSLAELVGKTIPGGCDDCTAHRTVERDADAFLVHVHHDHTCPTYRQIVAAIRAGDVFTPKENS